MNLNLIAKKPFFDLFYKTPCMPDLLRLAFNDAATGGPNSSIQFEEALAKPENAGLKFALDSVKDFKNAGNHITHELSLSDLIQLGGYAAVEYCGGPAINFRMGREDASEPTASDALANPNAEQQLEHTGLTKEEIVALMGRRTLGFVPEAEDESRWCMNPYVFDNTYFQELLNDDSNYVKMEDDLSLLEDGELKEYVEQFANDEEKFFEVFASAFSKLSELTQEDKLLSEI